MKRLLGIVVLSLLFSNSAFADKTVTFKCMFDRENYEYTINWYRNTYTDIFIRDMKSKDIIYSYNLRSLVDITVIEGDRSYNFTGFKNNGFNPTQHQFVFLDQDNTLFADLTATSFDEGIAVEFKITSFDNGLDAFSNGTCKAIY